mmetsp:Transcript_4934/g.9543  ORF Transcript_4934/g.9543 Transcript_4934/m.9543 type:complete len:457 (+) Transcript_4934:44-1414(+)
MAESKDEVKEVQIRFVTKLGIAVPDNTFAVPTTLARYGLSEIVNHFLEEEERRPFDFLVNNQFLRSTLAKYLTRTGHSGETGLTVEVVEAVTAPESQEGQTHPDWIASIAHLPGQAVVTACYDSLVRCYLQAGNSSVNVSEAHCLGSGHSSAVKAVACSLAGFEDGSQSEQGLVVSVSKDRTARLWSLRSPGKSSKSSENSSKSKSSSSSSSSNSSLACVGVCKGHSDSVESVAVSGSRFATGSWDSCIFLWDSSEVARLQAEQGAGKKQKTAAAVAGLSVGPAVCEMPEALLEGHSQCVSALVWPHPMALYSGSWDCSVRMWDTTTGSLSQTWHGKKQISGLSFSLAANLLASAHCDKVVALWDPRMGDGEAMKLQLRSHKAWVTDVNFAPDSAHLLASTSHDGSVKFWDTRASVPLHTISTHTDKVLSCCWYDGNTLLSGGSDCQLLSHTFNSS